jgi:hypothetical protein
VAVDRGRRELSLGSSLVGDALTPARPPWAVYTVGVEVGVP